MPNVETLVALVVKNPPVNKRDASSIPGLGRSPEEGNGNPLQYSCQDNPRDRGAWWAAVHGITKSWLDMTEQLNGTELRIILSFLA